MTKYQTHGKTTKDNDNQQQIQTNNKELLRRKSGARAFSTCKKAGKKRKRILWT
jgi:hypothetical protein